MPMINIFPALTNPYLLDTFSVVRRQESVSNLGISELTTNMTDGIYGTVKPATPNDLERLPDMDVQTKTISVVTIFPLRGEAEAAGNEFKPDLIVWNGDDFLVRVVEDYSNFAMGFVRAVCTSIDAVDAPPAGGPDAG